MRKIGIFTKPEESRATAVAACIAGWAADKDFELLINDRLCDIPHGAHAASDRRIVEECDFIVALGGDGTMLAVARLLEARDTPVLGVNLGTLGYLTEIPIEEVLGGDYEINQRTMMDWRIVREGDIIASGSTLNDVVCNRAAISRIIEIDCTVNHRYVTTYRADGLIIATPTGSTAYHLSAGGPIICPDVKAISLMPICPHTLTNRPLILPDTAKIRLDLKTEEQEVTLTPDGQTRIPLHPGDKVEIQKSHSTFNTVSSRQQDYFHILRSKLRWSGR
jgi:NAD+ kinase